MSKGFVLTFLGVVVAGAAVGAILAAQTGGTTPNAAAATRSGQGNGQVQGNSTGTPPGAAANGTAGTATQGNRTQNGANSNRSTMGTVKSIDGDVMTITTQQGETKVKLSGTRIQKMVDGTAEDIKAGERVAVSGQPGTDGVIAAGTVQIVPADATQPTGGQQAAPSATAQPAPASTVQPSPPGQNGQQSQDQNGQQRQQRQRNQPASGN